jgi:cytochrome c oxidase subunit 4
MAEHVIEPKKTYLAVFVALMVLTAVTTAVAFLDLGALNTPVALAVAVTKALLVVLVFMHVRHSTLLTKIVVFGGTFWLALLIGITMADYVSRGWLPEKEQGTQYSASPPRR